MDYVVQSVAPTGKAAKRVREATGLEAMTNHRMLGYGMPREFEVEDEITGKRKIVRYPLVHDTHVWSQCHTTPSYAMSMRW
jgi:exodeoxyribonuclease V alpha subunit